MWGFLAVIFMFFHSNDNLAPMQRYTGSYIVSLFTSFVFMWVVMVLHRQGPIPTKLCPMGPELYDWVSVTLVFGLGMWVFQQFLLMRYGTAQDHQMHLEIEFDKENPGAGPEAKERSDGLYTRFTTVPVLKTLKIMTPEQERLHKRNLEALNELARMKRANALPCPRAMEGTVKFRVAVVYFLVDLVWGIFGGLLALSTIGTKCSDVAPRVVTLVTVISAIFALTTLLAAGAFVFTVFVQHFSFNDNDEGADKKKKRLIPSRKRGVGRKAAAASGAGAGAGVGVGSV